MKKILVSIFLLTVCSDFLFSQSMSYEDSILNYQQDYVKHHEVVKGKDRDYMQFFKPDKSYRVTASFTPTPNTNWFKMETSGPIKKMERVYGVVSFYIHDTLVKLNLYQSQSLLMDPQYHDYLFLPFADATSGNESYAAGRYIDLKLDDIKNNKVEIDFNKAYNPYCAYVSGIYNCPIPPKENQLSIGIRAGEKAYKKHIDKK